MRDDPTCKLLVRLALSHISYPTFSQHRQIGKRKTIVIVAEGAHDADLQPIHADYVKGVLTERLGLDTRVTTLGHTQRGGKPCALDRTLVRSVFLTVERSDEAFPVAHTARRRGCECSA